MMLLQHSQLGEGFKPIERMSPLTHQNLRQRLLALSRRGRGRNNARRACCTRDASYLQWEQNNEHP
jgi:hypothetical protein